MPGVLYLVATPIGNLEDITLRALRVLREVDLVAAEDTRRTRHLLTHFGISTPLTGLREHNERTAGSALVAKLQAGHSIALVSDAGTPLVSDPGAGLVKQARSAEIRVEAVPGASAPLTALVASGLADEGSGAFLFLGFMPNRSRDRDEFLATIADSRVPVVFFEAPHRIRETTRLLAGLNPERRVALCRELTKVHEVIAVRRCAELSDVESDDRGEYTVVVEANTEPVSGPVEMDAAQVYADFCRMTEHVRSRREAIAALAAKYGRPQREIYRVVTGR